MIQRTLACLAALLLLAAAPALARSGTGSTRLATEGRPRTPTIGLGLGLAAPAVPLGVNTASARLRLAPAFTLEPTVGFGWDKWSTEVDVIGATITTDTSGWELGVGANLRYYAASHGPVDLVGIVGAGWATAHQLTDPEGTDNDVTTDRTTLTVAWGLGVEGYANEHWSLSVDATNPLLAHTRMVDNDEATEVETTGTGLSLGVEWAPTIRFMTHLYF